ncbi:hypothetical protein HC024_00490 [Methylococcaceae bacterium WWC4]|nr:hypothetical protein [Methylococcaceae bacterium WWC4]
MMQSENIDRYYELSPTQYSVVESLSLKQEFDSDNVMRQTLSVVMKKTLDYPSKDALRLDFFGVRNLKLNQPDWSLISIPHIEILLGGDVPRCTEKYYVHDPSQEQVIRFSCEDFHAVAE